MSMKIRKTEIPEVDRIVNDIRNMKVRGALNIAIVATKTMKEVIESGYGNTEEIILKLKDAGEKLRSSRPTAVSLPNSIDYVLYLAEKRKNLKPDIFKKELIGEIDKFIKNMENALERIAEIGSKIVNNNDVILTHCNSDTVIAILRKAWKKGRRFSVIVTETRPRLQGHITVKKLLDDGIPVTLIVDSAVCLTMYTKKVDKVLVGADAVCVNGDIVNKIGTSQIALCAKENGVKFIVAVESIKFSPQSMMGGAIEIEERSPSEVIDRGKLKGVKIYNPAFDITDADKIDMIITEFGIMPPEAVYQVVREKFSWEF